MLFKDIKNLIFDDLELIIDETHIENFIIDDFPCEYDYYEVIGIRSSSTFYDTYVDSRVVVSLKETEKATKSRTRRWQETSSLESIGICKSK